MEKMNSSYVSIIIPTYNREDTIMRAIQSVLHQSYPYFELIIVDDHSVDNTENVVQSIRDDRIKYYKLDENKGVSGARNEGVRRSKYDIIAFQDSDDEWLPQKLEKQILALEQSAPDVGLVYHMYEMDSGRIFPPDWAKKEWRQGYILPYLFYQNMVGAPTMLLYKECFYAVGGFCEELRCLEDYEFILRFSDKYKVSYIDEILLKVHNTSKGVNSQAENLIHAMLYIVQRWKREMLQYQLLDHVVDDVLALAGNYGCELMVARKLQEILDFEL